MNIVLDLLVIVVVGFLVFGGYKRGIIKTVTELISAALSAAVASVGASLISVNLYETFVKDMILQTIKDALPKITPMTETAEISESILKNCPSYVANAFEMTGVDINSLTDSISSMDADIASMVEGLIRPVVLKVFTVVITLVLFAVIAAIAAIVTKSVTSAVDTAGLSGVNRFFGAIIGFLEAAVIIMIFSLILYFLMVLLPTETAQGLRDAIDSTFIYRIIYYIDFPDMIISKLIAV